MELALLRDNGEVRSEQNRTEQCVVCCAQSMRSGVHGADVRDQGVLSASKDVAMALLRDSGEVRLYRLLLFTGYRHLLFTGYRHLLVAHGLPPPVVHGPSCVSLASSAGPSCVSLPSSAGRQWQADWRAA